jgi:hypothetical protein
MLHDQLGNLPPQVVEGLEVFLQGSAGVFALWAFGVAPGFFVYPFQQVECIKQEMARPAGRIKDSEIACVLFGSMLDVNGLLEEFLLGKIGSALSFRRSLFTGFKENLVRPPQKITTFILEHGVTLAHLIPHAAQGVVREELDHVTGGEKLVTDS